jgi:hypothetical protein|tara:strand:+ start:738 stop:896 length:159 start_codon:yes stop_codon:yes gene_type:complete
MTTGTDGDAIARETDHRDGVARATVREIVVVARATVRLAADRDDRSVTAQIR